MGPVGTAGDAPDVIVASGHHLVLVEPSVAGTRVAWLRGIVVCCHTQGDQQRQTRDQYSTTEA
jgi:hypothetical protein